ncbi:MAG: TatD family hydrolase [Candidatus Pacebacteria bacterium]|jgi:TatD DNase family protein|nr:TatD family hydrolase [Candidatus Paceibacterota bacterium]MDD4994548.1 TatD family hydrolase [Candidatus Paceibacterota bacterium]MDD5535242.1 TatD family hydrolase [Candidatus Paceibacterota bacterium]
MLFDSHTHLNLAAFDEDREQVLKRILKEKVSVINIGTCFETSKKAIAIANQYENCWATVGLHPSHTIPLKIDKNELALINSKSEFLNPETFNNEFETLLENPKVIAIGECGLDYTYLNDFSGADKEKYKKIEENEFRKQIQVAKKHKLVLCLHVRDLYNEALDILEDEHYENGGVFHFFTGNISEAKKIIEKGFYLGFSGVITYSQNLNNVIEKIPLEKILIETDAPYVAPVPYRGQRNEPLYVKEVAKKIAQIKKLPLEEIEEVTFKNAVKVFKLQ